MAESRVNTGAADAVQRYLEDREQRHLRGLADTELTVDLIGYGDDSAYGLAERGMQSINLSTRHGDLWEKIRNVGADLGPDAGLSGAGAVYNKDKFKPHVFSSIGSRGVVKVAPGGILTNPSISTGGIRHELAHRGFDALRRSMDLGVYEVPVPMDALSKVLEKGDSSDAEHLLIESLDASTRLKTGEKLSKEEQSVGRLGFDTIAQYMNDPSDENRDQALHRIQQALSRPSRSNFFDRSVYNTAIHMLKEDGVFSRKTPIANQILPYQLLDSLMQASMNFNTKPDTGREAYFFEEFDQGGVVGDYTFSPEDLYGLADTEFVVDLIGSGDDTASNLAQRGLREIQLRSPEGGLSSLIRNLGGDATVEELPLYIAGVPSAGVYNPNTFPVPVREGSSRTAYVGSRGPVNIPSRGIIVGQDAEKGVIRHELEHAGIKSIIDPLDVGMSPVESAPLSILSEVIRKRSTKDWSPYTSNPEHFLIESMQASEQLRSGEKLPEEFKEARESFYPIGRYLNNPTPENRDIVLRVLDDILTMPAKDYNKAPYGEKVILGARQDMLNFLRMDQRKRGVPEEYLFTAEEITPEMLLENLEKSIENFNAPVERGYSTKVFESGGEVGGSAVDLGQGSPLPSEQLSFGVGDYAIMPKVFAQGDIGKQSRNPFVETSEDEAFGKLGIEVLTPEGRRFGIGREANYLEGKMDFSDEARFFGAPESLKYGTDGVEYGNISGYYESPEGYRVEGSYNPDTDDYRIYGSRTIKFDEGGIVTVPVSRDPRPTDQRNEAFGAKLLKLAGLATTPRQLANRVDPKLYEQLDVVLGRRPGERSFKSPEGGIVSMKQY